MSYSTILFDVDGTLLDFERAQAEALQVTLSERGISFDRGVLDLFHQINVEIWRAFERGEITQERLRSERFERLLANGGHAQHDAVDVGEHYLDRLSERGHLLEGARELLEGLHGRYRLAVITNGIARVQHARIACSGLAGFFETVVISGEVGVAKPAARIFELALERLGNPARDRVLMVGDSLTSDIRGARDFGIDACWLRPASAAADGHGARFEIESLDQLAAVLAG